MCDPLSMIGMGLSVAGGLGQAKTQQNYVNAVNQQNKLAYDMSRQAREAERARQNAFETQANDNFVSLLDTSGRADFEQAQDAAAQDFVQTLDARPSALNEDARLAGQANTSEVVGERIAREANKAAADSRARVQALAKLQGATGASAQRGRARNSSADFMSIIGGLRRGSLGVAQQEQTIQPATVTPGSSTFADILSGVGGLMSMGAFGPGLFGGASSLAPLTSLRPQARPF